MRLGDIGKRIASVDADLDLAAGDGLEEVVCIACVDSREVMWLNSVARVT